MANENLSAAQVDALNPRKALVGLGDGFLQWNGSDGEKSIDFVNQVNGKVTEAVTIEGPKAEEVARFINAAYSFIKSFTITTEGE